MNDAKVPDLTIENSSSFFRDGERISNAQTWGTQIFQQIC